MKVMMSKETAIKRFVSYCHRNRASNSFREMERQFQLNPNNFEIDEPAMGKFRVFRDGNNNPKMIVFHTTQDMDRNQYPAISTILLNEADYDYLKNAFDKK